MELKITSQEKNPFLQRQEIRFEVDSEKSTPSRKDVKSKLVALTNSTEDKILVKEIKNRFGSKNFFGTAFLYASAEKLQKTHKKFALKKEGLLKEEPKKEAAEEAPPAPKKK